MADLVWYPEACASCSKLFPCEILKYLGKKTTKSWIFKPNPKEQSSTCSLAVVMVWMKKENFYSVSRNTPPPTVEKWCVTTQLRPRPHESGYFWNRIFFHTNRPSVHTKPVNPLAETASFLNRSPEWTWERTCKFKIADNNLLFSTLLVLISSLVACIEINTAILTTTISPFLKWRDIRSRARFAHAHLLVVSNM